MSGDKSGVAGLILAGGLATRLGGAPKGATLLKGRPLIAYALENFAKNCDVVAVSTRPVHQGAYQGMNLPLLFDDPAFQGRGPLVGLLAGLEWAQRRGAAFMLTTPCDAPFLPADLGERLIAALGDNDAAIAKAGGREHPLCAAWRPSLAPELRAYLTDPGANLAVKGFLGKVRFAAAQFPDDADFLNINTFEDLELAAQRIA